MNVSHRMVKSQFFIKNLINSGINFTLISLLLLLLLLSPPLVCVALLHITHVALTLSRILAPRVVLSSVALICSLSISLFCLTPCFVSSC